MHVTSILMPTLRNSANNSKTPSPNGNGRKYEKNNVEMFPAWENGEWKIKTKK